MAGIGLDPEKNTISLLSLPTDQIQAVLPGHPRTITGLAFSPDGKQLASCGEGNYARVWDVEKKAILHELEGHKDTVRGLAYSPDGRKLATISYDGTTRIWDTATGRTLQQLPVGHWAVAWSPDGLTLANSNFTRLFRIWDAKGTKLHELGPFDDRVSSLRFGKDSEELLYTLGVERPGCGIVSVKTGAERVHFAEHKGGVWSGNLSPDGTMAVTGGFLGEELYMWSTADGKLVRRFGGDGRTNWSAAWGKEGRVVAWGNTGNYNTNNPSYPIERAFNLDTLEVVPVPANGLQRAEVAKGDRRLHRASAGNQYTNNVLIQEAGTTIATLRLTQNTPSCFTYLKDGRVAVGSVLSSLYVFDADGRQERVLNGHTGDVFAISPSPDGRYILSASNDQTLRVWRPDRETPLLSLFFAGNEWIAWTPEGYYAASPGGEQLIGWQVSNGPDQLQTVYPAAQFRASLYRPDVIKLLLKEGSVEKALAVANAALPKPKAVVASVADVLPPVVLITSPDSAKFESKDATLDLKFVAKAVGKQPITAVRLLIDGRPYPGTEHAKTFDPPRTNDVRETWTVKLSPGTHTYAVVAETAASKGVSEGVEVAFGARGMLRDPEDAKRAEELQKPAMYVLAIGVSAYTDEKLKLNFAAKDAEAIAKAVEAGGKGIYRKVEAKVLTDKDATRKNILQGLTWMRKQMTQNDVGVISFAGHGEKDADGTFYLLPVDVDMTDLLSSAVPGDQIKKTLAGMPGKFVVLLDACHSGGIDGEKRRAAGSLTDDLVRDLATDEYGVVVLCSSTGREFSLESAKVGHGYFTLALIEGLNGKGPKTTDGAVYLHHLDSYVTDRVKELSEGRQHPVTSKPSSLRSFPLAKP